MKQYPGLQAPYWRFRATPFWSEVFPNGTYTADIQDCPWRCENCWSAWGYAEREPNFVLEPDAVVKKLITGMTRNAQTGARISGGEPALHWEHTREVIRQFLDDTRDVRIHVPGVTGRRGDPPGLVIETNGAVVMSPKRLSDIEEEHGEEAARIILHLGIKATHPEALQELTKMKIATCERFHAQQMANLIHAAYELSHLDVHASFLDRFSDPGIYASILREVERGRPGMSRNVGILDYKTYRPSQKALYVPKELREGMRDPMPAEDEETISALLPGDGPERFVGERMPGGEVVSVIEELDPTEAAELGEAFESVLRDAGIAEGKLEVKGLAEEPYALQHAAVPGERIAAELSKRTARLRAYARQPVTGHVKERHAGYLYASALELCIRLEDAYENADAIPARHWRTIESFNKAVDLAGDRHVLPRADRDDIERAVLAAMGAR